MANPFPFVAGEVLTAADMNGIGEYTAYTPTFTNLTLGNGTLNFRFGRVQNFIHVIGEIIFGSTTAVTGNLSFTLPATALAKLRVNAQIGWSRIDDDGTDIFFGPIFLQSTTTSLIQVFDVSGTYMSNTALSATVPQTWAVNDIIHVNSIYEAA